MGRRLAIDFGTTNSVIASWDEAVGEATFVPIPGLSLGEPGDRQALIPTLLYVQDGEAGRVALGQAVQALGLHLQKDNRLFRNFKRGLLTQPAPEPRWIDSAAWTDLEAARRFLQGLVKSLPCTAQEIEQLVVTVPVAAFDGYVAWLSEVMKGLLLPQNIRVVDESTAAALGYSVTEPGALVMVVDFGGGSLDLSLVQLPESRARTGGLLHQVLKKSGKRPAARVIAKAGLTLGGSDVDQWLLGEVLCRAGLRAESLGSDYTRLLTACEQAKISLSSADQTQIQFEASGVSYEIPIRQDELEKLLAEKGFYSALHQAVDKIIYTAHRQGIFKEDLHHVLLVGGTSLMPSVQRTLAAYFPASAVRVDKPFTAIAEGALQLAAGFGLEDYLMHSYGLRHFNRVKGEPDYEEVIPQGSRYPNEKPIQVRLAAAHPSQAAVEFVIAEIETDAVTTIEVKYEDGQAVFVAQARPDAQHIIPLNPQGLRLPLEPAGDPDTERLLAEFRVDEQRQLRMSVQDLQANCWLAQEAVIAVLGGGLYVPTAGEAQIGSVQDEMELQLARQEKAKLLSAQITGCEPALAASPAEAGWKRLSWRGLGTMLNLLPPEAVSLEAVREALRNPEFYVRYSAAELLSRRGDREARLILTDFLAQGEAPQRASVAHHLHRLSWFTAEPLLKQGLSDPDPRVREGVIYSLCRLRTARAYQMLMEALPKEGDLLRLSAVWALSREPEPEAVPALAVAMQAQDPDVRVMALEVLGATASAAAVPIVRQALEDQDLRVKYAAILSWVELSGTKCFHEIASLIENAQGEARRVFLLGFFHVTNYLMINTAETLAAGRLLAAYQTCLADPSAETRLGVVTLLAWMHHPQANALLQNAYKEETDQETKVRMLASALQLMSPAGAELMDQALQDPDAFIAKAARQLQAERRASWRAAES